MPIVADGSAISKRLLGGRRRLNFIKTAQIVPKTRKIIHSRKHVPHNICSLPCRQGFAVAVVFLVNFPKSDAIPPNSRQCSGHFGTRIWRGFTWSLQACDRKQRPDITFASKKACSGIFQTCRDTLQRLWSHVIKVFPRVSASGRFQISFMQNSG